MEQPLYEVTRHRASYPPSLEDYFQDTEYIRKNLKESESLKLGLELGFPRRKVRQEPETLSLKLELQSRNGKYRAKKRLSVLCAGKLLQHHTLITHAISKKKKKRPQVFPTAEMSTYLTLARIFSNLNHLLISSIPSNSPKTHHSHRFSSQGPRSQIPASILPSTSDIPFHISNLTSAVPSPFPFPFPLPSPSSQLTPKRHHQLPPFSLPTPLKHQSSRSTRRMRISSLYLPRNAE
jgi:hypothetical protein